MSAPRGRCQGPFQASRNLSAQQTPTASVTRRPLWGVAQPSPAQPNAYLAH
ncbi:unnamed protein product, partial [Gulo gulo]